MDVFKKSRAFRVLLGSQFISSIGDVLFYPILLILATKSSNVALMTGLVTLSETIQPLINLVILPRISLVKKRFHVLCSTYIIRFFVYFIIAILLMQQTDFVFLIIILLNVFSDVLGGSISYIRTDYMVNITEDTAEEQTKFTQMVGLSQTTNSVSQLIGLSLGGVLIVIFAPVHIAIINAFTFLIGVGILNIARHQFLKYDDMHILMIEENKKSKMNFKLFLKNKQIVVVILLCSISNLMFTVKMLFNNIYAQNLSINDSYSTFVFLFLIAGTLGMLIGGIISSVKKLKITFMQNVITIYILDAIYFIMLLYHQSLWLITICFIYGLLIGTTIPLLMGEIYSLADNDTIAGISSVMNFMLQLIIPLAIVIITILLQVIKVETLIIAIILSLITLSASLITQLVYKNNKYNS